METEEKKIYTIEDIARELGVSKTTVSRAISGKGRISQATRDRVRAFIKEHDYRPNVVAKGLAQRKTYNIALLMPKDYVATEFLFFKDLLCVYFRRIMIRCGSQMDGKIMRLSILPVGRSWSVGGIIFWCGRIRRLYGIRRR